ncbi:hypothetical protein ACLKA6_000991 [Drosophila palustris]
MDFIRPRNGNAALDKETPFRDQPLDLTTGYRHLFIRPRNGNAALDKVTPFRDQPLDLTTGYRHLYSNATPDRPTVAAIVAFAPFVLLSSLARTAVRSDLNSSAAETGDACAEQLDVLELGTRLIDWALDAHRS